MNADRIQRKINKLIDEVSGYVYRQEHEFQMPIDEERVAIMAALHGMGMAIGQVAGSEEREFAKRLSVGVAQAIGQKRAGSAHVAAPGGHERFLI